MAYSAEQRAIARKIVNEAHRGQVSDRSLADVRLALDSESLSISTLHGWIKGSASRRAEIENRNQLSEISETKTEKPNASAKPDVDIDNATVREILQATWRKYAKRANDISAVNETPGKDAVAAMERLFKLMQLVDGLPTEIIGAAPVLTEIAEFLRERNIGFNEAQEQFLNHLKARANAEQVIKLEGPGE